MLCCSFPRAVRGYQRVAFLPFTLDCQHQDWKILLARKVDSLGLILMNGVSSDVSSNTCLILWCKMNQFACLSCSDCLVGVDIVSHNAEGALAVILCFVQCVFLKVIPLLFYVTEAY